MIARVPCRCSDGACMLCDDDGMVPVDCDESACDYCGGCQCGCGECIEGCPADDFDHREDDRATERAHGPQVPR